MINRFPLRFNKPGDEENRVDSSVHSSSHVDSIAHKELPAVKEYPGSGQDTWIWDIVTISFETKASN